MATLEYAYKDYYTRISRYLGTGATPSGTALTNAQDIFHRAYRQFLYPVVPVGSNPRLHTWSFMRKTAFFTVNAGVYQYAMPLDYGDMETPFTYMEQDRALVVNLKGISEVLMLQKLAFVDSRGEPMYFCIREKPYDEKQGSYHEVLFYPLPNGTYTYAYTYNANPQKLEADDDVPMGGIECCECLMQMCLATAELQEDETAGVQNAAAAKMLLMAVQADKERNAADSVGMNNDGSANELIKWPASVTGDWRVQGYNVTGP